MKRFISVCALLLTILSFSNAQQQTMGLFLNDENSYNGYTLFAPMTSSNTYLIDNCGKLVHTWNSAQRPGVSVYLLENGNLLRTGNTGSSNFTAGGAGGFIEMLDWDSNTIWSYNISDTTQRQHHDVAYMPNGNILAIVWELKTQAEAIDAGRDSISVPGEGIWPDKIVELEPVGSDSANVVWEWHAWDHLIQGFDSTKSNYGVVADHPELINVNFSTTPSSNSDWLHFNGIDYNPDLDQIVISNHNFSEIWIIDHSTTTQEAASHAGGNSGMGGDLLYRWGNPVTYGAGTEADQTLFGQHDARWVTEGLPGEGNITIYNNGRGRVPAYSTVDEIAPPLDGYTYTLSQGQAYGPSALDWIYEDDPNTDFYSSNISGAHRLSNGNTVICEGANGRFFEVDSQGNKVWEYVNPIGQGGNPMTQGDVVSQNAVFRCSRYAPDYSGFQGQTLVAGDPIELDPLADNCSIITSSIESNSTEDMFEVYPNPTNNILHINSAVAMGDNSRLLIHNINGQLIEEIVLREGSFHTIIDVTTYPQGLYTAQFVDGKTTFSKLFSVIR